ncbi:AMP-binding protein, partial [Acinetobacter baumannii]
IQPQFDSGDIKLLHQFIEHHAREHPDKLALEFVSQFHANGDPNSQRWTYRELDCEANKVANLLLSRGVKVGDIVAVYFQKSAAASFAI